jgi:hypothetical protein
MQGESPLPRTRVEIRDLIEALTSQYLLGGPPVGPPPQANWDSSEAHGYILAALDDPPGHDSKALRDLLAECAMDSPAALRAVLRLVASYAAIAALSWVLDEPLHEPLGNGTVKLDRHDVLVEARAVLPEWMQL